MLEIIWTKIKSQHHDDPLAGYFEINKTWELVTKKYHWKTLYQDIESYIKRCDVYLASKMVRHKFYNNLQFLFIPTYWYKDFSIDFIIALPIPTNWKRNIYDSILIIVNWLIKILYYERVKVTIDATKLVEVIFDMIVQYYGLPNLIVTDRSLLFTSKFWLSLYYFLSIKRKLSIIFHPQTDN